MTVTTPTTSSVLGTDAPYAFETRFGIVMYGGVSLAIYINGVANEMYELACATPIDPTTPDAAGASGTREVYRRLSLLAGDADLRAAYAEWALATPLAERTHARWMAAAGERSFAPMRFVIDVISGTSAGGINGMFLAKVLANGEPFSLLKPLWLDEGDIGLLLHDAQSYAGLAVPRTDAAPASLLNSARMAVKLHEALAAMTRADKVGGGRSPWVDELDLAVTTTDIVGSTVALRLFDKVVPEKRHRQVFRLRYAAGDGAPVNDFEAKNDAFLAFAARCTSSFPFAFEPMTLDALPPLGLGVTTAQLPSWNRFFAELPADEVERGAHFGRAFGDGGYIDNKPFGYAVEALTRRVATVPVERKLIYVEPVPEAAPSPERVAHRPDAVENALAALLGIPRAETIREDLEAVLRRNRRIERIDRIVWQGEQDLERLDDPFPRVLLTPEGGIRDWNTLTVDDLRRVYGDAFIPYRRLRLFTVTDDLAGHLATLWGVDRESDHLYALRALVRAWRDSRYGDAVARAGGNPLLTSSAFLGRFDLQYRLRRLSFLLRKIDQAELMLRRRLSREVRRDELSEQQQTLFDRLARLGLDLSRCTDEAASRAFAALRRLRADLLAVRGDVHARAKALCADMVDDTARNPARRTELREVLDVLLLRRGPDAPLLELATDGAPLPVRLPEELTKPPSSTRTLQEGVAARARWLLEEAARHRRPRLHDALERDIDAVAARAHALIDGNERIGEALSRVRTLLGRPRLAVDAPLGDGLARARLVLDDTGVAELDGDEGHVLRELLGQYHLRFDVFDQMSFPLYYDTDTGEAATVEVVRISPEDATALIDERRSGERRRKLAGTALFNFGAFLDRRWRCNDMMWGRLDGAERLIHALLPRDDANSLAVRRELTREAHRAILREELQVQGFRDLTDLLAGALTSLRQRDGRVDGRELLDRLDLRSPAERQRVQRIVEALLGDDALVDWVATRRDVDRRLDERALLNNAARAVTVAGRVLEGVARTTRLPGVRWITRGGLAAQALVTVSVPGALRERVFSHWVKVLYAFELTVVAIGMLMGADEMRRVGLTVLAITLAVHLAKMLVGDVLRRGQGLPRRPVLPLAAAAGVAVLIALAALGLRAWMQYGLLGAAGL